MLRFAKENVIKFLVGNKCDLESKRQVTYDQGKELAKHYGIQFLETSAKDIINIDELFITISKKLIEKQCHISMKREPLLKKDKPFLMKVERINIKKNKVKLTKRSCCSGFKKI